MAPAAEPIELLGDAPRFVSRGGDKLEAALTRFGIDPTGTTGIASQYVDAQKALSLSGHIGGNSESSSKESTNCSPSAEQKETMRCISDGASRMGSTPLYP